MTVHLLIDRHPRMSIPACGCDRRWSSSVISGVRNFTNVTCKNCKRTKPYKKQTT